MQNKATQRFICIGLRPWDKNKYLTVFLDEQFNERAWKKPFGDVVGGIYDIETKPDDPGQVYPQTARFIAVLDEPEKVQEWRLKQQAARLAQEADRALKRAKKQNVEFGDLTLKEIKEMMRGQLTHQRHGMIAAINNYLQGW